jgi:predicted RNase H-like nuclease (RuvC/YqgF family)
MTTGSISPMADPYEQAKQARRREVRAARRKAQVKRLQIEVESQGKYIAELQAEIEKLRRAIDLYNGVGIKFVKAPQPED